MKLHSRKPFAAAVCLALLLASVLAGCTTTSVPEGTAAANETTPANTGAATQAPVTPEPGPQYTFPYTGEELTITGFFADPGYPEDTVVSKAFHEMIGNVKFEWELTTWDDYETKRDIYLSSGDVPDLMYIGDVTTITSTYATTGYLLEFSQYMDRGLMPNYTQFVTENPQGSYTQMADGTRYCVCNFNTYDSPAEGWFYNKTFLEEHDIAVPGTLDEWVEALRQAKAADPDCVPWVERAVESDSGLLQLLYGGSEERMTFDRETDTWYFGIFSEDNNYKKAMELGSLLYSEELMSPDFATISDEQVTEILRSGEWAFTYDYIWWVEELFIRQGIELDWEAGYMDPPSYEGVSYLSITTPQYAVPWWGYVVSAETKNPEFMAAYLDYIFGPEITELANWGVEGVTFSKDAEGNRSYTDLVQTPGNPDGLPKNEFGISACTDLYHYRSWDTVIYDTMEENVANIWKRNDEALASGDYTGIFGQIAPQLTPEESEIKGQVMTAAKTLMDEWTIGFINGNRSLSEWDTFISEVKNVSTISGVGDIQTVVDMYNSKEQYDTGD